jgi:hypothetical protein
MKENSTEKPTAVYMGGRGEACLAPTGRSVATLLYVCRGGSQTRLYGVNCCGYKTPGHQSDLFLKKNKKKQIIYRGIPSGNEANWRFGGGLMLRNKGFECSQDPDAMQLLRFRSELRRLGTRYVPL